MTQVTCCDVPDIEFPRAKQSFFFSATLLTLSSALFCLNWLGLTLINNNTAVINTIFSVSFYLKKKQTKIVRFTLVSIYIYVLVKSAQVFQN